MSDRFGPWASSIQVGSSPQLSAFWKKRMTMLETVSQTSPALSRRNLLWLGAMGSAAAMLPTVQLALAEEKPNETVLRFEIDPQSIKDTQPLDMDSLLKFVERRLKSGEKTLGQAKKLDQKRIEVTLTDPKDAERVKQLITRPGTLEFRILAHQTSDKAIVEQAAKATEEKRIAWWVPIQDGQEHNFQTPEQVKRNVPNGERQGIEMLVVSDDSNVTGTNLKEVKITADDRGYPCLSLKFDETGGKKLAQLTGSHLPDRSSNSFYSLGIILDGKLYSAPRIQSVISDSCIITGNFKNEEVADMVAALSTGSLFQLRLAPSY
jgi:preprotein translocase subunit SecD